MGEKITLDSIKSVLAIGAIFAAIVLAWSEMRQVAKAAHDKAIETDLLLREQMKLHAQLTQRILVFTESTDLRLRYIERELDGLKSNKGDS